MSKVFFLALFVLPASVSAISAEPCRGDGCANDVSDEEAVAAHMSLIQAKRTQDVQHPTIGSSCDTCKNGHGTWQHYGEITDYTCICQSCNKGYHMTDMYCLADTVADGETYRITNDRFGTKACLDHHAEDGSVGAYPCNDHGGQSWKAEATTEEGVFRFTNARFGTQVCLDHHAKGSANAYPCDNNGGDGWKISGYPFSGGQLTNARFGNEACLDNHVQDGLVITATCDSNGGDDWNFEPYSASLLSSDDCIPIGSPCDLQYVDTKLDIVSSQFEHPPAAKKKSRSCCNDETGAPGVCVRETEDAGAECASP